MLPTFGFIRGVRALILDVTGMAPFLLYPLTDTSSINFCDTILDSVKTQLSSTTPSMSSNATRSAFTRDSDASTTLASSKMPTS